MDNIVPMAVQDRLLRGRFEILYREKMVVNYREESLKVLLENTK